MDLQVSALGAIVALVIAIILILKKVSPAYGMMIGAFVGGLIGGANLVETVDLMMAGAQGIITSVLRILAAGILAGVLIESGAANIIAETIVDKIGERRALLALALATMILTMVGVFIDVAVITVAPIALAIAKRANLSRIGILIAMIGGGKAGNIMSPNPNAIAASDAFDLPLTSVMLAGVIPAIFGVIVTYFIANKLANKGIDINELEIDVRNNETGENAIFDFSPEDNHVKRGETIYVYIKIPAGSYSYGNKIFEKMGIENRFNDFYNYEYYVVSERA